MTTPAPLLSARNARIAIDDVIALDALTLDTRGDRVLFVGDVSVLFGVLSGVPAMATAPDTTPDALRSGIDATLSGEMRLVGGDLRLAGHDVATHAHLAISGFAPLDPPVPRSISARDYLTWAARLTGIPARAAPDMATSALRRVGLEPLAQRPAATLGIAERRALQLAKAIVHAPPILIAEAPLDRLEGPAATFVAGALAAATEGRRALLSARRIDAASPESTLARAASHLIFLNESGVLTEGPPSALSAATRLYRLTVPTNAPALATALASRGLTLSAGPLHFTVSLPEGATTADLLTAASEARAPLIELVPLTG